MNGQIETHEIFVYEFIKRPFARGIISNFSTL
jgi:hypothetical protein